MSVRDGTIDTECHITGDVHSRRTAGGNDTGRTGDGQHTVLWNVYLTGESAGRGSDSGGTWCSDTAAVYAGHIRSMDPDKPDNACRRKTVSDR